MSEVLIRPAEPADRNFILDSAWRSIREHPSTGSVDPHVFSVLLEPLLGAWTTLVVADPEHARVIHSWLCYRDAHRVAWGFTKPDRRAKGLMRALRTQAGIADTFELVFPTVVKFERLRPRWRPYLALEAA